MGKSKTKKAIEEMFEVESSDGYQRASVNTSMD